MNAMVACRKLIEGRMSLIEINRSLIEMFGSLIEVRTGLTETSGSLIDTRWSLIDTRGRLIEIGWCLIRGRDTECLRRKRSEATGQEALLRGKKYVHSVRIIVTASSFLSTPTELHANRVASPPATHPR